MTTTEDLAQFITELQLSDIPESVVEKAKQLTVHAWGVQLAASTLPWSKIVYRYIRDQGGRRQATVVNYGHRTTSAHAAFANSAFGHGFEIDDNHARTSIKGGSVIIPTALAVGERERSSGRQLLTAIVLGYEVLIRAALAIHPGEATRGTHWTGTSGAIGAAAVACKLMGLPAEQVAHALSSGAASRAGFYEMPSAGRGHLKRIFGAMAAAGGIRAADLAAAGMTGPMSTLDVGSGMCRAYGVDESQHAHYVERLGTEWEILNVVCKVYAQDGDIQPMSEGLEKLRAEHGFAVGDIERVWIGTNHHVIDNLANQQGDPEDVTDAQFHAGFSVAMFLVRGGAGFHEYTAGTLADPAIRAMRGRIEFGIDEEIDAEYRRTRPRGAKVRIHLTSGEVLEKTIPDLRKLGPDELDDKFRSLSQAVVSGSTSEQLLQAASGLEHTADIRELVPMLVRS